MSAKYKILIGMIFFLTNQHIYCQFMPDWLKMEMTLEEIEIKMGEKLFKRKDDLYLYTNLESSIFFQFDIDPEKGLISYWVIGKYFNINAIVEDFNNIFGRATYIDNIYWWTEKSMLPKNIKVVIIFNKENYIHICYFFENSLE